MKISFRFWIKFILKNNNINRAKNMYKWNRKENWMSYGSQLASSLARVWPHFQKHWIFMMIFVFGGFNLSIKIEWSISECMTSEMKSWRKTLTIPRRRYNRQNINEDVHNVHIKGKCSKNVFFRTDWLLMISTNYHLCTAKRNETNYIADEMPESINDLLPLCALTQWSTKCWTIKHQSMHKPTT